MDTIDSCLPHSQTPSPSQTNPRNHLCEKEEHKFYSIVYNLSLKELQIAKKCKGYSINMAGMTLQKSHYKMSISTEGFEVAPKDSTENGFPLKFPVQVCIDTYIIYLKDK